MSDHTYTGDVQTQPCAVKSVSDLGLSRGGKDLFINTFEQETHVEPTTAQDERKRKIRRKLLIPWKEDST